MNLADVRYVPKSSLFQRCPESFVQRVLGEIEVAQQPNQSGQNPARFGPIEVVEQVSDAHSFALYRTIPWPIKSLRGKFCEREADNPRLGMVGMLAEGGWGLSPRE